MPPRLTEAEAVRRARAVGVTPLDPYPGTQQPWRVRCDTCGDERTPRLSDMSQRHAVRCSCYDQAAAARAARSVAEVADELAGYGLVLVGPPPRRRWKGTETPGRARCTSCGDQVPVLLGNLRAGCAKGCACDPPRLTPREGATCPECDEPVWASGLCRLHYNEARLVALAEVPCTVDGCDNGQRAGGLCASHYTKGQTHVIGDQWGWNPALPATLYLVRDERVWKYGKALTHRLPGRLAQHAWHTEVVDLRHGTGAEVTAWERAVRASVRHLPRVLDGRDGQRETHYRADLDPTNLAQLLDDPTQQRFG